MHVTASWRDSELFANLCQPPPMDRRRSASPPRRSRNQDEYHDSGSGSRPAGSSRRYNDRRDRDYERRDDRYSGREREYGGGGRDRRYPEDRDRDRPRRRDDEDRKYGYSERDREQERDRDRQRYDDGRRRDEGEGSRAASLSPRSKAKPDFKASGLLAAETNTVRAANGDSTVLKYNEPPEARKPVEGWRLYVFKGEEQVELLHIHRQSAYLIGRDRIVADISVDHPSCSKQHAVIQYRFIQQKDEFGASKGVIKPFIIDLESTNGTFVNGKAIPVSRYYELQPSDVIKFGTSTREYVLLHDEAS
ncbi:FHA domain-containing protein [Mycena kentingensis (nom. inval.)]|nr:FHA domain-containing protein [Mycena kentingensis (nom. inval.)]